MIRLMCQYPVGLRFCQALFENCELDNLRRDIFYALARHVGWQEARRESNKPLSLVTLSTIAHELDPGPFKLPYNPDRAA